MDSKYEQLQLKMNFMQKRQMTEIYQAKKTAQDLRVKFYEYNKGMILDHVATGGPTSLTARKESPRSKSKTTGGEPLESRPVSPMIGIRGVLRATAAFSNTQKSENKTRSPNGSLRRPKSANDFDNGKSKEAIMERALTKLRRLKGQSSVDVWTDEKARALAFSKDPF